MTWSGNIDANATASAPPKEWPTRTYGPGSLTDWSAVCSWLACELNVCTPGGGSLVPVPRWDDEHTRASWARGPSTAPQLSPASLNPAISRTVVAPEPAQRMCMRAPSTAASWSTGAAGRAIVVDVATGAGATVVVGFAAVIGAVADVAVAAVVGVAEVVLVTAVRIGAGRAAEPPVPHAASVPSTATAPSAGTNERGLNQVEGVVAHRSRPEMRWSRVVAWPRRWFGVLCGRRSCMSSVLRVGVVNDHRRRKGRADALGETPQMRRIG